MLRVERPVRLELRVVEHNRRRCLVEPLAYLLAYLSFARLAGAAVGRYNGTMNTSLFEQVRELSVEEQLELVEALWDSLVDRNAVRGPTNAQEEELGRRLVDHADNPEDVVPWDEVKDSALTRIGFHSACTVLTHVNAILAPLEYLCTCVVSSGETVS
jgi:putative addiction module component (TIGR02574 family)